MKKHLKSMALKFGGSFAALAIMITTMVANSACVWVTYQEKMPKDSKNLRKF